MKKILFIPDTQVQPNHDTSHLQALGNYVVEHQPDIIVHAGDHWDMASLSSYDKGKLAAEGARYQDDIDAGIEALERFDGPINVYNNQRSGWKKRKYLPEKHFLCGNHEERIERHVQTYPYLKGKLSYGDFKLRSSSWKFHPFLFPVHIHGIYFSHYWTNPDSVTGMPFGCSTDTQLTKLGFSFVQGHRQGLYTASPRFLPNGKVIRGLIAGSFYQADFHYRGNQGVNHWRGAIQLNEVDGTGWFSPIELSIEYLLKRWY
jgi:hypothetical protein